MKKLLTFLPALALCVILSGCGSLGNINQIANTLGIGGRTYTFESLPQNLDQLKALPEASLTDPYAVAALTLAALTRYGGHAERRAAVCGISESRAPRASK